jgi:hypothetical protein
MSTRRDSPDGPEDIDAAFAEIVAGLQGEMPFTQWPEGTESPRTPQPPETSSPNATTAASTGTEPLDTGPEDPDEDHYRPPEPPPLPKPRLTTIIGFAAIGAGFILLLVPGLTGRLGPVAVPLGLVAISVGIGWLLFRMRQGPPDSGDDGARL